MAQSAIAATIGTLPSQIAASVLGDLIPCGNCKLVLLLLLQRAGVGPYTYAWNSTPVQTTSVATGLTAGAYIVNITDSRGCTFSNCYCWKYLTACSFHYGYNRNSCFWVVLQLYAAPVGTTSYLWSNGDTTRCTSVTTSGNYSVTITNYLGCKNSKTVATTMEHISIEHYHRKRNSLPVKLVTKPFGLHSDIQATREQWCSYIIDYSSYRRSLFGHCKKCFQLCEHIECYAIGSIKNNCCTGKWYMFKCIWRSCNRNCHVAGNSTVYLLRRNGATTSSVKYFQPDHFL